MNIRPRSRIGTLILFIMSAILLSLTAIVCYNLKIAEVDTSLIVREYDFSQREIANDYRVDDAARRVYKNNIVGNRFDYGATFSSCHQHLFYILAKERDDRLIDFYILNKEKLTYIGAYEREVYITTAILCEWKGALHMALGRGEDEYYIRSGFLTKEVDIEDE